MSQETKKAMFDAIKAHYVDTTDGGLMTDFVLGVAGVATVADNSYEYLYEASDSPFHACFGLANMTLDYFSDRESYEDDDE